MPFSKANSIRLLRHLRDALVTALALFTGLNLAFGVIQPSLDGNWLWIGWSSGRPAPTVLLLASFCLVVLGWRHLPGPLRWPGRGIVTVVAAGCAVDVGTYYRVLADGDIATRAPVPLSLLTLLLTASWAFWPPHRSRGLLPLISTPVALGAWIALLVASFATTSYARRADAIVVFGARVYDDGTPSLALYDRTRTAALLYHRGLAEVIVMSGGHTPGVLVSEPEAMRRIATDLGVPSTSIVLDTEGINTRASIHQVARLSQQREWGRLVMVSHDYHCARIKLASMQQGLTAFTVPAVQTQALAKGSYFFCREIAAWGWYWLRPVLPG